MSVGASTDYLIDRLQKLGPYAITIALAAFGLAIHHTGVHEPIKPLSLVLRIVGVVLCVLCPIVFSLWHFWQWPPWFGSQGGTNNDDSID